jgi:hypothetical protein
MKRAIAAIGLAIIVIALSACQRERKPAPVAARSDRYPDARDAVQALQKSLNSDDCGAVYDVSTLDFHSQIGRKDSIAQCRRMAAVSGAWINSQTLQFDHKQHGVCARRQHADVQGMPGRGGGTGGGPAFAAEPDGHAIFSALVSRWSLS